MTISQVKEEHTSPQEQRLAEWIEGEFDYERPRRREIREAVILDISENDIVVDLGVKRDGIVPPRDLELLDDAYRASLHVGDRIPVFVLMPRGDADELVVSINKGLQQVDWLRAKEYLENEQVFEAEVTDVNRGGVVVRFGRLRGFVPNSHLASISRGTTGERLTEAKSALVGTQLSLVVLEVDQRQRRLVLSERMARRHSRKDLLEGLTEGEVRTGIVSNLVHFGAFVDLGGIDGLIHISELDWKHVSHPKEVLNVGDEVEVYVLRVDRERERIGLSRKRLLPDPWYALTDNLTVGQTVEGTITNVVEFGAFVDVGQGIEGLVHASEMPEGQSTLRELEPGSQVAVRVLDVDQGRRRISLALQEAAVLTAIEVAFSAAQGSVVA